MTPPPEARNSLVVTRNTTASRQQVWTSSPTAGHIHNGSSATAACALWTPLAEPGSTIHHSIGVWPALLNDETVAVACEPLQELVLVAKGRPSGLRESRCGSMLSPKAVVSRCRRSR